MGAKSQVCPPVIQHFGLFAGHFLAAGAGVGFGGGAGLGGGGGGGAGRAITGACFGGGAG